jgi:hypothetical protein
MFLKRTEEIKGVDDNRPPSNQIKHIVVDEVVNDDELVKDVNPISLKERLAEDVEGDEFISNYFSKKKFAPLQDEALNEP